MLKFSKLLKERDTLQMGFGKQYRRNLSSSESSQVNAQI